MTAALVAGTLGFLAVFAPLAVAGAQADRFRDDLRAAVEIAESAAKAVRR